MHDLLICSSYINSTHAHRSCTHHALPGQAGEGGPLAQAGQGGAAPPPGQGGSFQGAVLPLAGGCPQASRGGGRGGLPRPHICRIGGTGDFDVRIYCHGGKERHARAGIRHNGLRARSEGLACWRVTPTCQQGRWAHQRGGTAGCQVPTPSSTCAAAGLQVLSVLKHGRTRTRHNAWASCCIELQAVAAAQDHAHGAAAAVRTAARLYSIEQGP